MALILERNNMSAWKIHPDMRLLASIYGVLQVLSVPKISCKTLCVCVFTERSFVYYITQGLVSGLSYYITGWASKERGPLFVSAFNPLSMVIVAILSSFIFLEKMYIGR